MKKILLALTVVLTFVLNVNAQEKKVPSVNLKNIDGKTINTADLSNDGKPYIINFWATWCAPCKRELSNIAEVYDDWVDETGVKIYAVSIDDSRTTRNVKPYINKEGWDYEILLDENSDFKRAMGVNAPPYTFIVDGSGNIVYQHVGYSPGDEEEIYEKLMEIK
jgi:peroxiredoxin